MDKPSGIDTAARFDPRARRERSGRTEDGSITQHASGQPGVGYAFIGGAFGLLLVYFGARIPSRILSWPVVGIGTVFIVVMTSYAFVTLGQQVSARLQPLFNRLRGHDVTDPQLGALTREVDGRCWIARLARGDRTIDVVIDGDHRPNPTLLASARDLVARFDTLERDVTVYLAAAAEKETSDDPESAAEIRALRISSITLRSPASPARVVVDLEGRDDMRYWYCDYVNGDLSGLRFDT